MEAGVAMVLSCTILSTAITLVILILARRRGRTKLSSSDLPGRLPPGPPAIPIIGHLHLLRPPPHQALHKLAKRYGPVMHLRLGSVSVIIVSSPDMAREFLKTHDANFANRPLNLAARRFAYDGEGFAFAPYGPYWKFLRKLCVSELLGSSTLDQLLPVRRLGLHEFVRTLVGASRRKEEVNVSWELVKMSNGTLRRSLTGSSPENRDEAEEAMELTKQVAVLVGSFNVADFIPVLGRLWDVQGFGKRIEDVHRRFDALMEKIILTKQDKTRRKDHSAMASTKDLVDILLQVSEDDKAEIKLTRENIKSFVLDVFTAGTDTTAVTLEWALAEMMNHPETLEKAKLEIDKVIGKDRIAEESDISKLQYLQAIVKETLRLHPAAVIAHREAIKGVTIKGYGIPAGCQLFVNLWSLGRDPGYWEDPLEFKPERFLKKSTAASSSDEGDGAAIDFRGQYYQYLPFGSGRRICPGSNLAMRAVHTTLAALVQCFEWKQQEKLDMSEGVGMVCPRAHPILCVPVVRSEPFPPLAV